MASEFKIGDICVLIKDIADMKKGEIIKIDGVKDITYKPYEHHYLNGDELNDRGSACLNDEDIILYEGVYKTKLGRLFYGIEEEIISPEKTT